MLKGSRLCCQRASVITECPGEPLQTSPGQAIHSSPGRGRLTEVDENGMLLGGQLLQELFVGYILWLLFTGKWMFKVELLS